MQQRVKAIVDLLLPTGAYLVVKTLDMEAGVDEVTRHLVANVYGLIVGSDGEVSAFDPVLAAKVAGAVEVVFFASVPPALVGVDFIETSVDVCGVADGIEEVELGFCAKITGVGDARGGEILFCLACHVARISENASRVKGSWTKNLMFKVFALRNGSKVAVARSGSRFMSDSSMVVKPRIEEPSKARPSSIASSSNIPAGMEKCCSMPGRR